MRAPSRRDGLVGMHNIARFRIVEDHHAPLVIRPKHLIYGHFLRLSPAQPRNSIMRNALSAPPSKAVIWYVTSVHLVANTPMQLTLWGDNIRARLVTDVVTPWREALRGWMSANHDGLKWWVSVELTPWDPTMIHPFERIPIMDMLAAGTL